MHTCPNCGAGELKIIAAILERPVIEKILTHMGLDPLRRHLRIEENPRLREPYCYE